ncbi:MAG: NUDIX domain-containing protein [Patescibacteria group bacterium]
MREIDVAMAVIRQDDKFYLQLRSSKEELGAAGLVGCFGGQVDTDEPAVKAVSREINEETTLESSPTDFQWIGKVRVVSDRDLIKARINADVFGISIPPGTSGKARQGELISWARDEIKENQDKLTPATRACFKYLIRII